MLYQDLERGQSNPRSIPTSNSPSPPNTEENGYGIRLGSSLARSNYSNRSGVPLEPDMVAYSYEAEDLRHQTLSLTQQDLDIDIEIKLSNPPQLAKKTSLLTPGVKAQTAGSKHSQVNYGALDYYHKGVHHSPQTLALPSLSEESDMLLPKPSTYSSEAAIQVNALENKQGGASQTFFQMWYDEINFDYASPSYWKDCFVTGVYSIPAMIIGTILNILDAVSYGIIIFPTHLKPFSTFGPDGISIFLVSTVIAQLTFASGASKFAFGNGGFMVEVIPFVHILCQLVINDLGEDSEQLLPTVMVAFALSTILTGVVFLLLGWFKLGSIMEFFPRHILIGCIGGLGVFLFQTGFKATTDINPEWSWESVALYFQPAIIPLWTSSFLLCGIVILTIHHIKHPLIVPMIYLTIPVVFYIFCSGILGLSLDDLRATGWVFKLPDGNKPFYDFYLNFNFYKTSWSTIPKLLPTIAALIFFGILHVPINVPALAVSSNMKDVDVDRELVAHGVSNLVAGFFGSGQNYLIYSNSVLFNKSGGTTRVSTMLLTFATFGALVIGPQIVGYIPVPLVGVLVFNMGFDLFKEAIWDPLGSVPNMEYLTIVIITIGMGVIGFIEGIFFGIIVAFIIFIVEYSRRSPVRYHADGTKLRSIVRRPYQHRQFLTSVGEQIQTLSLQGYMFFGTVHQLDTAINAIFKKHRTKELLVRFIILDFTLVTGLDFSAANTFSNIVAKLKKDYIFLVLSGLQKDSDIGKALIRADVWPIANSYQDEIKQSPNVRCFSSLNVALEWCENFMLAQLLRSNEPRPLASPIPQSSFLDVTPISPLGQSPRSEQIIQVAQSIPQLTSQTQGPEKATIKNAKQPLPLLVQAFQDIIEIDWEVLCTFAKYLERVELGPNERVWAFGDVADDVYLIEQGMLKADNQATLDPAGLCDTVLPGTFLGEITFFNQIPRFTTVTTDSLQVILWKLTRTKYLEIVQIGEKNPQSEESQIPLILYKMALAYSVQDQLAAQSLRYLGE